MAYKSNFHGDVGQAVIGNVIEAPRIALNASRSLMFYRVLNIGPIHPDAARIERASSARLTMLAQSILSLLAGVSCGWLLWAPAVGAASRPAPDTRCFIDGRAHSIGSSTKMADGALRECMANASGGVPVWGDMQTHQ